MDFAALPPEINSNRMYAGPGSGPMVLAAEAWDVLAAELNSIAASFRAVMSQLTGGPWIGPSAESMTAAVTPYASWISATAAKAGQTAGQLRSAVAAYEGAFSATVPPSEIEVNRALLASLVATNILGQNAPAISAVEAQYAQMWAQDAAAMYGYAGASAAATTLTPFNSPKQVTNPSDTATQAATVSQATGSAPAASAQSALSSVPSLLQGLSSGSFPGSNLLLDFFNSYPVTTFNSLSALTVGHQILSEGLNFDASGLMLTIAPAVAVAWNPLINSLTATTASDVSPAAGDGLAAGGLGSTLVDSHGSGLSAGLGEAATVGKLSVPQSWGTSPAVRLASAAIPTAGLDGLPQVAATGPAGFSGAVPPMGPVASVVNSPRGEQTRVRAGSRHKVIPGLPGESGMQGDPAARWARPTTSAPGGDGVSSERDELNQLRRAMRDVAKQRDALKRTAALLIQEAKDT
jgi:PPE-repeat protein